MRYNLPPTAFAKQLKKMPARELPSPFQMRMAELSVHIISPTGWLADSLALITWWRLNTFYGQKQ